MAGIRIEGNTSGNVVEVTGSNQLKVIPETNAGDNPQNVGSIRFFSENDPGDVTGTPYISSPETDDDYRLRTSVDTLLDLETFNYAAQNTGKHTYANTTITATWATSGLTTNGSNVTTTGTGLTVGTYAEFPLLGNSHLFTEFEASLTAQPTTNFIIDFGFFRRGASTAYAPTDGAYFRLNASGWQGVINYNGSETVTTLNFTYETNKKYQFIIAASERSVEFWIDNVLYGKILTPAGQGQPFISATLPLSIRHAHTGTTAGVINLVVNDYNVTVGGSPFSRTLGEAGNAALGSYQGLSGGTMGSLSTYPNSSNPTAATPGNTSLTANLPGGLGGQGAVTAAAAAATDGIWGSYQVPAGTTAIQGKRLKITGILVDAVNAGAAVATTATTIQFSLSFGATNVSLATTEAVAAKAPRRISLGFMTWPVAAAIGAGPQGGSIKVDFSHGPIYVNPGEFVQLAAKFLVGTATASQVINFVWQPIYSWE
jgi:hypothetical protein